MDKPRLLIIDDDSQNLVLLQEFLSSRYHVDVAADPRQGVTKALEQRPNLVVCDIDMPGMNGYEVVETIRASAPAESLPIVFLTSDPQASSMQRALKLGANDYLIKPFRMQDLLNRLELRLGQAQSDAPIQSGNLNVDPAVLRATLEIRGKQKVVRITRRNLRVLQVLLRNEGRVLTREQLLDQAWDGEDASDRSVDLHIFRLRRLLKGWNRAIETVYGRGYAVVDKRARRPR